MGTTYGTSGNDSLSTGAGSDSIYAGAGNDTVTDSGGQDTIYGGDGNDRLNVGDGASDSVFGGSGHDTITSGGSDADSAWGDAGNDSITMSDGANLVYGGGENDTIAALGGHDTVFAGSGNDSVTLGSGNDSFGSRSVDDSGDDTVYGGLGQDSIIGGAGNDRIYGDDDNDVLSGQSGSDTLYGGLGNDTFTITDDHDYDRIDGGTGTDTVEFSNFLSAHGITVTYTGAGAGSYDFVGTKGAGDFTAVEGLVLTGHGDTVYGGADTAGMAGFGAGGNDSLIGGSGQDLLYGGDGVDTLSGGAGHDALDGGAGHDLLWGGEGNDTLAGGAGNDTFEGGSGQDNLDYSTSGGGVTVDLVAGTLTGGDATGDVLAGGIDGVIGSGFGDRLNGGFGEGLSGDIYTTQFYGLAGNDTLYGNDGGDLLFGGADQDLIFGGTGNDSVFGGDGSDTLRGGAGGDSLDAGAGDDWVTDETDPAASAWGGADTVALGDGQDVFLGSGNNAGDTDLIYGGAGNDTVTVMQSWDTVYGGDGDDSIATTDEIASYGDKLYGDAGNDRITGANSVDTLYGGTGKDTLTGGGGADSLDGGDDADLIYGGAGDTVAGGEGGTDSDTLVLTWAEVQGITYGGGNDEAGTVSFHGGGTLGFGGIETIRFSGAVEGTGGADTLGAGFVDAEGDQIDGADGLNDRIYAGAGHDSVAAGQGADAVYGGEGRDTLAGGGGADTLAGGAGEDRFVLADSGGADRISDFDLGDADGDGRTNDQLDVSDLHTAGGGPIKSFDVAIGDDGFGNAVLTFPGGESVVLQGVSPALAAQPGQLHAMGVPCFAGGTLIATPRGERAVEDIAVGDLVLTRAGAAVPVLWHGVQALGPADLAERPDLRPIRIEAGRLGARRALTLSPQHAVMITGPDGPVLVRARHLAEFGLGARVARGIRRVTYHHVLLPQHAVILAEGCPTESFYPGPMALAALSAGDRMALVATILGNAPRPQTSLTARYGPRCLKLVSRGEVRGLADSTLLSLRALRGQMPLNKAKPSQ